MGIEVQTMTCQPSQTVYFTFAEPPQDWVVGLTLFTLTYGPGNSHSVETLSINLEVNLAANQLGVTVRAQLSDHSSNTIDVGASSVTVGCVAVTGSSDPYTALANVPNVTQQDRGVFQLPGNGGACTVLTTCLSGFNLSYDTTDHEFQGATAVPGIDPQSSGPAFVTATADMWNGETPSNHAVTAAIDAGVLASVDDPPPFMVQMVTAYNYTTVPPIAFPSAVGPVITLIQSFNVQYASDEYTVQNIVVGCGKSQSVSGSTVTLGPCWAYTDDNEGNSEDNALSSVNVLVIAVPSQSARS